MKLNDGYTTNYLKTSKTSELRYVYPTNICGAGAGAGVRAGVRAGASAGVTGGVLAKQQLRIIWPAAARFMPHEYSPVKVVFL